MTTRLCCVATAAHRAPAARASARCVKEARAACLRSAHAGPIAGFAADNGCGVMCDQVQRVLNGIVRSARAHLHLAVFADQLETRWGRRQRSVDFIKRSLGWGPMIDRSQDRCVERVSKASRGPKLSDRNRHRRVDELRLNQPGRQVAGDHQRLDIPPPPLSVRVHEVKRGSAAQPVPEPDAAGQRQREVITQVHNPIIARQGVTQ